MNPQLVPWRPGAGCLPLAHFAPAAAPLPLPPGPRGYLLQRLLGRGRQAGVYLALHLPTGQRMALKLAPRDDGFAAEFAALQCLAHPNVLRAMEHGSHAGAAFLAMEYAAQGPLESLHARPLADVQGLMLQAAAALAHLHGQGWVHRDIKPANLLLRGDGSLALGDFGTARRAGAIEAAPAGTLIGTPRYAAPEQAPGAPALPTADVYSLGVVLHELLAGRPPYPGDTLAEIRGQHMVAPLPRLPVALARWQPLLDAMLAKKPRERLADGQAVREVLQQLAGPDCRNAP